jgi:hypothetical protein
MPKFDVLDLPVPDRWFHCPACDARDHIKYSGPVTRMHSCQALGGLVAPFVEVKDHDAKADAKHEVHKRDDYTGHNQPVQSVRTHHADGRQDVNVFPMAAQGIGESQ